MPKVTLMCHPCLPAGKAEAKPTDLANEKEILRFAQNDGFAVTLVHCYTRDEIIAKEVVVKIKLQAPGGQATPAPPIGPALGQNGVNIGQFVSQFNERTKELNGTIVPVVITVFKDKSFTFEVKSPPAAVLLKQAAEIAKGSGVPNKEKVGEISAKQLRKIAQTKFKDLNAYDIEQAEKIIRGTARSMGVEIID